MEGNNNLRDALRGMISESTAQEPQSHISRGRLDDLDDIILECCRAAPSNSVAFFNEIEMFKSAAERAMLDSNPLEAASTERAARKHILDKLLKFVESHM